MRWGGGEGAQEWAREIAGAREWDWMGTRESREARHSIKGAGNCVASSD